MKKVSKKVLKFISKHKIIIAATISLALFMGIIMILSRKSHMIKPVESKKNNKATTELVGNPIRNPNVLLNKGEDHEEDHKEQHKEHLTQDKDNINFDIIDNKSANKNGSKCGKRHKLQKSHANKCYSCEHELPFNEIYRSQKTKCFSCEQDLKERIEPKSAFFGQPSKCFDCEAQLK